MSVVRFNVGGVCFETLKTTLCSANGACVMSRAVKINDNELFVDRDSRGFAAVLNFLRNPTTYTFVGSDEEYQFALTDAKFYSLPELTERLEYELVLAPIPSAASTGSADDFEEDIDPLSTTDGDQLLALSNISNDERAFEFLLTGIALLTDSEVYGSEARLVDANGDEIVLTPFNSGAYCQSVVVRRRVRDDQRWHIGPFKVVGRNGVEKGKLVALFGKARRRRTNERH